MKKKALRWLIVIFAALAAFTFILMPFHLHIDMPLHDYDKQVQQKNSQIAKEKVTVSNYRENVIMLDGTTLPAGLDVRFDVTQKSWDYRTVYLDLGSKEEISLMDCEGVGPEAANYGNSYALNAFGKTEVHFQCVPRFTWLHDDPWLHNKPGVRACFRPILQEEMLAGNLKEYDDYRHPTAAIGVGLDFRWKSPTQNTPVITDLVTPLMPAGANLRNEKFWRGIIRQSLQPNVLTKAGYTQCYTAEKGTGWLAECYCK